MRFKKWIAAAVVAILPLVAFAGPRHGSTVTGSPITTYVLDPFNNTGGSNAALAGWVPQVGVAWTVNGASAANNAQVAFSTDNVVATTSTASYYQNQVSIPQPEYSATATLADTSGTFSSPSLLLGFSSSALDGYRIGHDNNGASPAQTLIRFNSGAATTLATQFYGGSGGTPSVGHTLTFSRWVLSDRVRLKIYDATIGLTWVFDDLDATRRTATAFPGLSNRLTGFIDDFSAQSAPAANPGGTQLIADGSWSWYSDPRIITIGGRYFISSVNSAGTVTATKLDSGAVSTTPLATLSEIDDHNNGAWVQLPGGRLLDAYSQHSSDTVGMRYRVSTNPAPDISAFNTEVDVPNIGGLSTSYTKPFLLSDGVLRVWVRAGTGTERPYNMYTADAANVESNSCGGAACWSNQTVWKVPNQRPYIIAVQNGADRIDFSISTGHPNEVATSMYHCYMQIVGGVVKYFKSDGTQIVTALPIDPSVSCTLVQNTTGGINWNWAIQPGADGQPRMLLSRYPTSPVSNFSQLTDIEYWAYVFNGTSWNGFRIATGQHSLYPNQSAYAGGLCYDGNDTSIIYQSLWDTTDNVYKLSKWSVNEGAQTVTKLGDISTDATAHSFRCYSPKDHGSDASVFWLTGGYANYQQYQTTIRYNFLLKRDMQEPGAANDNDPVGLEKAA